MAQLSSCKKGQTPWCWVEFLVNPFPSSREFLLYGGSSWGGLWPTEKVTHVVTLLSLCPAVVDWVICKQTFIAHSSGRWKVQGQGTCTSGVPGPVAYRQQHLTGSCVAAGVPSGLT